MSNSRDYAKMAAVRDYLVELTCAVSDAAMDGPFEGYDSTETELYFMRKAVGPLATMFGIDLESRASIDLVAQAFISQMGL